MTELDLLTITVNSSAMGDGMTAKMQGQATHSTKLIKSFAHNLNRLESALYNIDGRIESAKKNALKREKTCYFERAKLKHDAMKLAKKPRKSKDKGKDGQSLE